MTTPLVKGRKRNLIWVRAVLLYTAGGVMSAAMVGVCLGWLGHVLTSSVQASTLWELFAVGALVLLLRDLGLLPFNLPQCRQQAPYDWIHRFDRSSVFFMWGFHIGIGLSTFIVFSGLYVIAAAIVVSGSMLVGVSLMVSYWVGRALAVWVAPSLSSSPGQDIAKCGIIDDRRFRTMAVAGLVWCVGFGVVQTYRAVAMKG